MVGYSTSLRAGLRPDLAFWKAQIALHYRTLALFALLQLADIVTTGYGLSHGITAEYNPLAASLLGNGLAFMLATKALVVAMVAFAVVRLSLRFRRIWAALWIGNTFYLLVITLNVWSLMP